MANFSKKSGNSTKGVELIAVLHSSNVSKDGKTMYVEFMVDNSEFDVNNIEASKVQSNPQLYSRGTYFNKDSIVGYEHAVLMHKSQVDAIEAFGGDKAYKCDDLTYVPFKSDLMGLYDTVEGEDGKPVSKDGKPVKKLVGYIPNTKTLALSERGVLDEDRLSRHAAGTTVARMKVHPDKYPEYQNFMSVSSVVSNELGKNANNPSRKENILNLSRCDANSILNDAVVLSAEEMSINLALVKNRIEKRCAEKFVNCGTRPMEERYNEAKQVMEANFASINHGLDAACRRKGYADAKTLRDMMLPPTDSKATKSQDEAQSAQRAKTKAAKLQEAGAKAFVETSVDKGKEASMGD